jgi:LysM repeat protein
MGQGNFEDRWMKKARMLTQALLFSAALNIGLLGTFLYFVFKDKANISTLEIPPKVETVLTEQITIQKIITSFSTLSFQELLLQLGVKDHVEQGFTKRDLALACLVAFHHFNLERALGGLVLQTRKLYFANPDTQEMLELIAYPGLADYQYQAIAQYAETEKWPFTPRGIFFEIQAHPIKEPSLLEAFYLTPHFHFVHTLFTKSGTLLKKEILVQMLAEGNWALLDDLTEELRKTPDFSLEQRRDALLRYFTANSKTAALLLLQLEPEFALKKLDDGQVLHMMDLLGAHTPKGFAKEILASPRSDPVLKMAAAILYVIAQEPIPDILDLNLAKQLFLGIKAEEAPQLKPITKPTGKQNSTVYIIQPGDSLWKISNKFKVSVEAIMRLNKLESERLKVGKPLQIPVRKD